MRRDILLLTEMIDAAEQAQQLASGLMVGQLEADRAAAGPSLHPLPTLLLTGPTFCAGLTR
jgi:hypothetical protein